MPKDFPRSLRIAQQIQRELADILRFEVKDPRISRITLVDVEVTLNGADAKIYFTTLDEPAVIMAGLNKAKGFLRNHLAKRIKIRVIPQLHFFYDTSIEQGIKLSRLIDDAVSKARD